MATLVKTRSANTSGNYAPTDVDARKAAVDFRLTAMCPNFIIWRDGRSEQVNDRKLASLQAAHTWATDF